MTLGAQALNLTRVTRSRVTAVTATGWFPLFAAGSVVVPVTLFAWTRRHLEIDEIVMPSLAASYLGFLGFALARAPFAHAAVPDAIRRRVFGPFGDVGPLTEQWPLLLVAGTTAAAIITVVAVPLSMLPGLRRKFDRRRDAALWTFVEARSADRLRMRGSADSEQ